MYARKLTTVILIAFCLTACGDKPDSHKPSVEQKTPDYRVGDVINTAKFTISIDRVETRRSVGNQYIQKQASSGGIYVVINYTYKNISNKPIGAFSLPMISLRAPDGSKYSADIDASSTYAMENQRDEKILSDLNPGIQTHGSQVFEIGEQMYSPTTWKVFIDADKEVLVTINAGQNQTRNVESRSQNQSEQNVANTATGRYTDNTHSNNEPHVNHATNEEPDGVVIQRIEHPEKEPTGLYIVDFDKDANSSYTYRVYCPTNTVRNVSNNHWGQNKTANAEDQDEFSGEQIMTQVLSYICTKQ